MSCSTHQESHLNNEINSKDSSYVFSYLDSANSLRINGNLSDAKVSAEVARLKSESLNWGKGLAASFTNLAYINLYENDFEAAMENAVKGLDIAEKIGDSTNQGFANLIIGYVYFSLGDTNQVLPYYNASLSIRKQLGDDYDIGYSYSYLGNYYLASNHYDSALFYHKKALETRLKTNDVRSIADSYLLIGSTYKNQGYYGEALRHFEDALKKYEAIDDQKRLAETYRNFAEIYIEEQHPEEAKEYLLLADSLAKLSGALDNSILIANQLSEIESSHENYKVAYDYLRFYVDKSKESSGEAKYKDIVKNVLEYKSEKEKKIQQLEYDQKEYQQKMIVVSVIVLLLLVVSFLLFIANRLRVTRGQKDLLAIRKQQVDEAYVELEMKNKDILDSITYAKRIQSAILPSDELIKNVLNDSFILYQPKDIVAGDFYWIEQKEDRVFVAACDCTGHGVPGAMVSVVCNNALNRAVREFDLIAPGEILDKTRDFVQMEFSKSEEDVHDGMDVALFSLQEQNGKYFIQYAGANNPLWIARDGNMIEVLPDRQPVGKFENSTAYKTHSLELQKNDVIYIFSDGYKDQFGGERQKKMKAHNFKKLLLSIHQFSMDKQKEMLTEAFNKWKGDFEQIDDVCVIGVRV